MGAADAIDSSTCVCSEVTGFVALYTGTVIRDVRCGVLWQR